MLRAVIDGGVETSIARCDQRGFRHRSDSRLRKIELKQIEEGRVSTDSHVGFDDLRRSVDLRIGKPRGRSMMLRLFGLNDGFSDGHRSVSSSQPKARGNG